jgi:hypothetical protein
MRILRDFAELLHAVVSPLVRPALLGLPLLLLLLFATARDTCACQTVQDMYRVAMRVELKHIVEMQESHRAAHGYFLDSLVHDGDFPFSTGVVLRYMRETADGFDAEVAYPSRTANRCRISHRWAQKPEPTCDSRRHYQYWLE